MTGVDEAIQQLERLYRSVTGKEIPTEDGHKTTIPPEKDPGRHIQEQVDRLLEVLRFPPIAPEATMPAWTPRCALWEGERERVIQVELPGVPRENVRVTAERNLLTVSGERPARTPQGERSTLRATEIPVGTFSRSIVLPDATEPNQVRAQLKDGILEVRIPTSSRVEISPTGRSSSVQVS